MGWIQIILLLIQVLREIRDWKSKEADKAFEDAGFIKQGNNWRKTITFKRRRSRDIIYNTEDQCWYVEQNGGTMVIGALDNFEGYMKQQKDSGK